MAGERLHKRPLPQEELDESLESIHDLPKPRPLKTGRW